MREEYLWYGGAAALALGVGIAATHRPAACDPANVQTRPVPTTTPTLAQVEDAAARVTAQLQCLGYGRLALPRGANDAAAIAALEAAVTRFGTDHPGAFAAYGMTATPSSSDDVAQLKAIDDAFRAKVGAARASDYVAPTAASSGLFGAARHRGRQ